MTATVTPLAPSLRGRLAVVLGALDFSLVAGHCAEAVPCSACGDAAMAVALLNAEVAEAVLAVRTAPTNAAAMGAYFDCLASLAGLGTEVEDIAARCGTTSGGDAGTEDGMKNAAGVTA